MTHYDFISYYNICMFLPKIDLSLSNHSPSLHLYSSDITMFDKQPLLFLTCSLNSYNYNRVFCLTTKNHGKECVYIIITECIT